MSLGAWVQILHGAQTLRSPSTICVELSPSVHCQLTRSTLWYCCTLYNFSFLVFRKWRSCPDRVWTLNTNITLQLFWPGSTRSQAQGKDSAICAGLAHWRDYSYCIYSEQKRPKRLGHCVNLCFLELLKILWLEKQWELVRAFQTSAPRPAFALIKIWLITFENIQTNLFHDLNLMHNQVYTMYNL